MKAYLFDFDGTLVDSMPTFAAVMTRILDENSIEYSSDLIKIITPLGFKDTAKYFREKLGLELSESETLDLMTKYAIHEYTYNVPAKHSVIETLRTMKSRGFSLNVLTASPHDTLVPCLKRLGIYELFDNVWSCNDFGTNKANPEIYKMAARRIGTAVENVVFLDDNYNADKTAKLAGMEVVGVFDESSADYADEIKSVTDAYIRDFSELLALL